jgi:hypothetical protein
MIMSTIEPTVALARPYPSLDSRSLTASWLPVTAAAAAVARVHGADANAAADAAANFRRMHATKQAKGNAPPRGTPR